MLQSLSGAIIAAGRGERLRPATAGLPKPLVELDGRPLLLHQIEMMRRSGIRRIHVIVNSETARLIERRAIALPAEVDLIVADTANSMESLLTLGTRIPSGWFFLATVDAIVAPAEFRRFHETAQRLCAADGAVEELDSAPARREAVAGRFDGALGVVRWRGDARPLFVDLAADGSISRLGGEQGECVTAGLYCFATRIFDHGAEARALGFDALRRFLGFLLEKNLRFAAIELTGAVDVDEGADLEQARIMFARRREDGASG